MEVEEFRSSAVDFCSKVLLSTEKNEQPPSCSVDVGSCVRIVHDWIAHHGLETSIIVKAERVGMFEPATVRWWIAGKKLASLLLDRGRFGNTHEQCSATSYGSVAVPVPSSLKNVVPIGGLRFG